MDILTLKNTKLGFTIILCSIFGGAFGFSVDSTIIGIVIGIFIGMIIGNMISDGTTPEDSRSYQKP